MGIVDPKEQPNQIATDYDASAVESVKIERNSKGYNWSLRVVVQPGESWQDAFYRLCDRDGDLRERFS